MVRAFRHVWFAGMYEFDLVLLLLQQMCVFLVIAWLMSKTRLFIPLMQVTVRLPHKLLCYVTFSIFCIMGTYFGLHTIKSYTITEQGDEQITGFHLAGDLVGFDAIGSGHHPSFAQALETSMVCEIPFETLDDLSGKMPNLRQQMMRLMSGEIKGDQDMILLLSKKNAEERLAAFIYNLSRRFAQRGFSPREFRLTMTRGDIGNYLGLTVETISRLLGRFQKSGMLAVKGKYITIENGEALAVLAGHARNVA